MAKSTTSTSKTSRNKREKSARGSSSSKGGGSEVEWPTRASCVWKTHDTFKGMRGSRMWPSS
eukprot:4944697-Lingulodinium_polyedra.AAC.1